MDDLYGGRLKSVDMNALSSQNKPVPNPAPAEEDPFTQAKKMAEATPAATNRKRSAEEFMNATAIKTHPVLAKLRSKLGINPLVIHEHKIYVDDAVMSFGFTEYPDELNLWCANESRRILLQGTEEAKAMKSFDILRMGVSLVHIDGAPIYEVLGINPVQDDEQLLSVSPTNLSNSLRKKVAYKFYELIMSDLAPFVDSLEDFFVDNIVNKRSIRNASEVGNGKELHICEAMGCTFQYEGKAPLSVHGIPVELVCPIHKTPLKKALSEEQMGDLPLV